MDSKVLESGVTHPRIDLDFHEWYGNLSIDDRDFILHYASDDIAKPLLMLAWQRSRETLRQAAEKGK